MYRLNLKESGAKHDESTEDRVSIALLPHALQTTSTVEDARSKHDGERHWSHLVVICGREKGRREGGREEGAREGGRREGGREGEKGGRKGGTVWLNHTQCRRHSETALSWISNP